MTHPRGTRVTYYKFLLPGRITPVQKSVWPVRVGVWTPKATPVLCVSGWHASEEKDLLSHIPSTEDFELWEVEGIGKMVVGDDKAAFEQMKLVRLIRTFDAKTLRLFACAVAEDVLPIFEKGHPKDNRPREAIEVARRFANGQATKEELEAAAWAAWAAWAAPGAAWAAAWAAWAAPGAAWTAAGAAWAAPGAAWTAAGAAWAAWAAELVARDAAGAKYSTWLVEGWPE